jgi:hypothetical protein
MRGVKGHFVSEIWHEPPGNPGAAGSAGRWVMLDPNADAAFIDPRTGPLATFELAPRGGELARLADLGPGAQFHRKRLGSFIDEIALTGACYRLWSVWRRNDFLSRPECTPPAHGLETYSETDLVWCREPSERGELDMFPHLVSREALDAPPPAAWREALAAAHT